MVQPINLTTTSNTAVDRQQIIGNESKNSDAYLNEENNEKQLSRIKEQDYLIKNFVGINSLIGSAKPIHYTSVSGNPEFFINTFLARKGEELWNISQRQLSALVPQIRVFKALRKKNGQKFLQEFVFDNNFPQKDLSLITTDNFGRGGIAGIQSFSWKDMSKQIAETDYAFEANLKLWFQSPRALFEKRTYQNGGDIFNISYADIISFAPVERLDDKIFNPEFYEIHVKAGWAVPSHKEKIFSNELIEEIRQTQQHFVMFVAKRDITYNENGTVSVSVKMFGRAEVQMSRPETDILYVNERNYPELTEQLNRAKEAKTQIREKLVNRVEETRQGEDEVSVILAEGLAKAVEEINRIKREIKRKDRTITHSRILETLLDRGLIYPIDIDVEEVKIKETSNDVDEETERLINYKETRKPTLANDTINQRETVTGIVNELVSIANEKDISSLAEQQTIKLASPQPSPADPCKVRINVVRYGDLLDVVFNVLYENQRYSIKDTPTDISVVLGSLYVRQKLKNGTDKLVEVPIKDIPISVNLFVQWWLDNIISKNEEKFVLNRFLRSTMNKLILNILSSSGKEDKQTSSGNLIPTISTITMPKATTKVIQKGSSLITNKSTREKLQNTFTENETELQNYLFVYFSGFYSTVTDGRRDEDISKGVYHFDVGSPVGLLKKIDFSQTTISRYLEANFLENNKANFGDLLRLEPFNAKIKMFGNSLFKNGAKIFIEPNSLGLGFGDLDFDRMKIGGYFDVIQVSNEISSGNFTTTLEVISQNTLTNKKVKKKIEPNDRIEPSVEDLR